MHRFKQQVKCLFFGLKQTVSVVNVIIVHLQIHSQWLQTRHCGGDSPIIIILIIPMTMFIVLSS